MAISTKFRIFEFKDMWIFAVLRSPFFWGVLAFAIISIAPGLNNFIGAQGMAKRAAVRANMAALQIAVQAYFHQNGRYPAKLSDAQPFLPPQRDGTGLYWSPGINPCTGGKAVFLLNRDTLTEQDVLEKRGSQVRESHFAPGLVTYSCIDNGKAYAIMGIDQNSVEIANTAGRVLVLPNP